jgi:antitoxin CcdA
MVSTMQYDADALMRVTNVSLNESLLAEARDLQNGVSPAAEHGVAQVSVEKRAELWLQENTAALDSSNEYMKKHGLPLARFRPF